MKPRAICGYTKEPSCGFQDSVNNVGKRYEVEEEKEVPGEVVETKVENGKRARDDTLGQVHCRRCGHLSQGAYKNVECGETQIESRCESAELALAESAHASGGTGRRVPGWGRGFVWRDLFV